MGCYKVTETKRMKYWYQDTLVDQWKRIECPEVDPHVFG